MESKRRIRVYPLRPEIMPGAFVEGAVVEVLSGIPSGARFCGYVIDSEKNNINMFVEHESFEEIPEEAIPPRHLIHVKVLTSRALQVWRRLSEDSE